MSDDRASKLDDPVILSRTSRWQRAGVLVFALLFVAFPLYRTVDTSRRANALTQQQQALVSGGHVVWSNNCATCHGTTGEGGEGPALNSKEFLSTITDEQMHRIISAGITSTDMPTWLVDFGGQLTDQQIAEVVAYIRAWQPTAPSCPDWRLPTGGCGGGASPTVAPVPGAIQVGLGEKTPDQMFISLSANSATAGSVTFQVTNQGQRTHEFVVLRTDTPADQLPIVSFEGEKDRIDEAAPGVTNVGETGDMKAGETKLLTIKLAPGHYVVVCNLPGHYRMGMHADFTVN
jgi:mono/diheme cytochrome c family protein/uncharacterized cupredoxin-like copper-binding protein